jgi:hypothetical protein
MNNKKCEKSKEILSPSSIPCRKKTESLLLKTYFGDTVGSWMNKYKSISHLKWKVRSGQLEVLIKENHICHSFSSSCFNELINSMSHQEGEKQLAI